MHFRTEALFAGLQGSQPAGRISCPSIVRAFSAPACLDQEYTGHEE